MGKTVLFSAAFLFFISCHHTTEQKPDADRVIKDTLAQILLQPFNQSPNAANIYIQVEAKESHFLCARNPGIMELTEAIKSPPQWFVINASQSNNLQAAHGTGLSFEPGCFIDKNGNKVCGPVEIALKECYSLKDQLTENISTANDDATIQSKAVLLIRASSGGEELQLGNGSKINISFPVSPNTPNYQLFYGKEGIDGDMKWKPALEVREINLPRTEINNDLTKPSFSFNGLGLIDYLQESIRYPEEAKRNELSQKVELNFVVNESGKVIPAIPNEVYKTFKDEIARVLEDMPLWQPAYYNGEKVSCVLHINIDFNIRRTEQVQVAFNETEFTVLREKDDDKVLPASNKNNITVNCGRLGWLCLGKYLPDNYEKADVIVPDNANCMVRLLAQNYNLVASGENCLGYTRFKSIPVGTKTYIVATKKENGNAYYALTPLQLKKQNIVTLAWKKGDENEIEKALAAI